MPLLMVQAQTILSINSAATLKVRNSVALQRYNVWLPRVRPSHSIHRLPVTERHVMPQKPIEFIAYYRVSTERQGRSGLGLEAQQAAVHRHLATFGGSLIGEHIEVETGKRNKRPELHAALAACRRHRVKLVIAKLDCRATWPS